MDFHVRSDSVDVEQIMGQIRGRIRDKRGADYTEAELQHLASVKLERFLDSRGVRSTLVEAFKKTRVVDPELESYTFTDTTLYETHRGWLRPIRKLFKPILQLFFNPDRVSSAFKQQQALNRDFYKRIRHRDDMDPLYYEVIHNLVLEITRLGIDVQNLKMRVESLSSRVDFDERRARSLEGMVQQRRPPIVEGRPDRQQADRSQGPQGGGDRPQAAAGVEGARPPEAGGPPFGGAPGGGNFGGQEPRSDESRERRRRRRRRRRRPGQNMGMGTNPQGSGGQSSAPGTSEAQPGGGSSPAAWSDDGGGDDGPDDGGDDGAGDNGL